MNPSPGGSQTLPTDYRNHPLYKDEALVADWTDRLVNAGHSVFQLFQFPSNEEQHSLILLDIVDPKRELTLVMSLGCGVAGMEAYWKRARPELKFHLVNTSKAQLQRSLCDGDLIRADAQSYSSQLAPFDLVVIAYMLGHVEALPTLRRAAAQLRPGGKLFVYDVFNGTEEFSQRLCYRMTSLSQLEQFGVQSQLRFRVVVEGGIPVAPCMHDIDAELAKWLPTQATPALFVFQQECPAIAPGCP